MSGEPAAHFLGVIGDLYSHIQGVVVVDDLEPGLVGGRIARRGLPLYEFPGPLYDAPGSIVEMPIDDGRLGYSARVVRTPG
jgi:hypothetical protein